MQKIYLNCERKDIARLTGEILKKLDKQADEVLAIEPKYQAMSDEELQNQMIVKTIKKRQRIYRRLFFEKSYCNIP